MEIVVEKTEIENFAKELYGYSEQLEDQIQKIRNILVNINNVWKGNDASKYTEVLNGKYVAGLEDLKKIISEYAIYLNNIPEVYEMLDNIYSNKKIDL